MGLVPLSHARCFQFAYEALLIGCMCFQAVASTQIISQQKFTRSISKKEKEAFHSRHNPALYMKERPERDKKHKW